MKTLCLHKLLDEYSKMQILTYRINFNAFEPIYSVFHTFSSSSSVINQIYSNSFQIWPYLTSASKLSNSSNWKLYQMHGEKTKIPNSIKSLILTFIQSRRNAWSVFLNNNRNGIMNSSSDFRSPPSRSPCPVINPRQRPFSFEIRKYMIWYFFLHPDF